MRTNIHHIDLADLEIIGPEDNFYALHTNQHEQRADRLISARASQRMVKRVRANYKERCQ